MYKKVILFLLTFFRYGWSQIQKLPINNFRWLTDEEIRDFNFSSNFNGEKGYLIECDLHYPKHLHKLHANLPLAPELLEVNFANLAPFVQDAIESTEGVRKYKDVKLMSTFHDKIEYVCHIRNLQLYLSLGLVLKKVHRILEFNQDYVLKPYIEQTTKARQNAVSKFEKDLFKILVSLLINYF